MKTRKGGNMFSDFFKSTPSATQSETQSATPPSTPSTSVKSPYLPNSKELNPAYYNATDYMNTNGMGSKLSVEEATQINDEIVDELDQAVADAKDKLIGEHISIARNYEGKIKKAIVASIGAYNFAEQTQDKMNPMYAIKQVARSNSRCGTVTCKGRGLKIKKALKEILELDAGALGNLGLSAAAMGAFNYVKNGAIQGMDLMRPRSQIVGGTRKRKHRR
jgi:hypothetical protein